MMMVHHSLSYSILIWLVEIALRNVKEAGVEVEFQQGSAPDIPFYLIKTILQILNSNSECEF